MVEPESRQLIAAALLQAPAVLRLDLGAPSSRLRERAAERLAAGVAALLAPAPAVDARQLELPMPK